MLVLTSQFSVLSSQFSVLSSQFSVLSSQFSVLSSSLHLEVLSLDVPFRDRHSCGASLVLVEIRRLEPFALLGGIHGDDEVFAGRQAADLVLTGLIRARGHDLKRLGAPGRRGRAKCEPAGTPLSENVPSFATRAFGCGPKPTASSEGAAMRTCVRSGVAVE